MMEYSIDFVNFRKHFLISIKKCYTINPISFETSEAQTDLKLNVVELNM